MQALSIHFFACSLDNQEKEKQPLPPPRPQRPAPGDLVISAPRWQNSWLFAPPGASRHKLLGRIFYPLRFFDLGLDAPTKGKGDGPAADSESKAAADANEPFVSTMLAYPASVLLSQHFAPYVADGGSESGRRLRNVVVIMEWQVSSDAAQPTEEIAPGTRGLCLDQLKWQARKCMYSYFVWGFVCVCA